MTLLVRSCNVINYYWSIEIIFWIYVSSYAAFIETTSTVRKREKLDRKCCNTISFSWQRYFFTTSKILILYQQTFEMVHISRRISRMKISITLLLFFTLAIILPMPSNENPIPFLSIIILPQIPCPDGQRYDQNNECRTVET